MLTLQPLWKNLLHESICANYASMSFPERIGDWPDSQHGCERKAGLRLHIMRKSVTTVTNLRNASCPEAVHRLFLLDHTDSYAIRWYYPYGVIVVTTLPVGFRSRRSLKFIQESLSSENRLCR